MNPTIRSGVGVGRDAALQPTSTTAAVTYAAGLLAAALGLVVVLAVGGSSWPPVALVLLLAIPLAWCMNRYVLFPNEVGVTGDAAVVVAAMLLCRTDAPWLGPIVVALLVGVLDVRHWEHRSFARMTFNSGSTALVTAAALVAFTATADVLGTSWDALLVAVLAAAVPYVVVETVLGVVLVVLLGERAGAALRHQLPLDALAFPLALVGALGGAAGLVIGWWAAPLALLPAAFVPELVLVVLPRRLGAAGVMVLVAGALLAASVAVEADAVRVVLGAGALSLLAVAEQRPRRRRVVGAPGALVVAAAVGAVIGLDVDRWTTGGVGVAVLVGAAVIALGFGRAPAAAWGLALLVPTAAVAVAATEVLTWTFVVVACGMALVALGAAAGGPLPWASRWLGPSAVHTTARAPVAVAGLLAALAAGASVVAASASDRDVVTACALVAVAGLGTLAALVLGAVRLWIFAPRRRRRDVAVVVVAPLATTAAYLPLAIDGAPLASVLVVVVAAAMLVGACRTIPREARIRTAPGRPS